MAVDPLIRDILDKMLTAWEREIAAEGGALAAEGGLPVDNGDGTMEQRDPAWWDAFYWPSADLDADGEGFDVGTP